MEKFKPTYRIQSVENTKKITRAMKMVAAAKVKKAENIVKAGRPFSDELMLMFRKMLAAVPEYSTNDLKVTKGIENYPVLLEKRDINTVGILVLTSNKGLAGAYNANIVRLVCKTVEENNSKGLKSVLYIVGQKGVSALKRRSQELDFEIAKTYLAAANDPTSSAACLIAEDIAEDFVSGKIDKIEVITTKFKNMMSYSTQTWDLLPIDVEPATSHHLDPLMEFDPSAHAILQKIVPLYISNSIYQGLLEAQASELASRMTAMSAASNNAEEMITTLTIDYNKARQAAITQELVEIVSGSDAQKG